MHRAPISFAEPARPAPDRLVGVSLSMEADDAARLGGVAGARAALQAWFDRPPEAWAGEPARARRSPGRRGHKANLAFRPEQVRAIQAEAARLGAPSMSAFLREAFRRWIAAQGPG